MKIENKLLSKIISYLTFLIFVGIVVGCASSLSIDEKPGAMLWGENCGRCHNIRPPSSLTDAEWDLAVLHMKTRANLTENEADKIVAFLKAGN
jgi:hypothetical protein